MHGALDSHFLLGNSPLESGRPHALRYTPVASAFELLFFCSCPHFDIVLRDLLGTSVGSNHLKPNGPLPQDQPPYQGQPFERIEECSMRASTPPRSSKDLSLAGALVDRAAELALGGLAALEDS